MQAPIRLQQRVARDLRMWGAGWANPSGSSALEMTVSAPHLLESPTPGTPGGWGKPGTCVHVCILVGIEARVCGSTPSPLQGLPLCCHGCEQIPTEQPSEHCKDSGVLPDPSPAQVLCWARLHSDFDSSSLAQETRPCP